MENNKSRISFFWTLSRFFLIVMSFYPLFKISENASLLSNSINGSALIYIILMFIVFIGEVVRKKKKDSLKLYTGILSLIYGVVMLLSAFQIGTYIFDADTTDFWYTERFQLFLPTMILMVGLCIWMILFGIYDLKNRKIKDE